MGACLSKSAPVVQANGEHVQAADHPVVEAPLSKPIEVEETANGAADSEEKDDVQDIDHMIPYKPSNEEERIRILHALGILDTEKEGRFDNITQLLCAVFDVPIAAVSLVDKERQWFKAIEGLGDVCQTGRDVSFCGWTILPQDPRILIVEDALKDVRFSGNPLVAGPPFVRFYAGAPLISSASDYKYGSLCVIDTKPHHEFTADQYNMLAQFAELVVREIEKDKLNIVHKIVQQPALGPSLSNPTNIQTPPVSNNQRTSGVSIDDSASESSNAMGLARAADCFRDAVLLVDANTDDWQVLYANSSFETVLGLPRDEASSQGFWDMFDPIDEDTDTLRELAREGEAFRIGARVLSIYRLTSMTVSVDFQPAATGQIGPILVGIPSDIAAAKDSASSQVSRFYFTIIRPEGPRNSASQRINNSVRSSMEMQRANSLTQSQAPSGGTPILNLSKAMPTAFTDVKLGPLIGRGAYGRVYRGIWNGNTVAVKVMETDVPLPEMVEDLDPTQLDRSGFFEALLSSHLSHPNVVHTYHYATRPSKPPPEEETEQRLSWESAQPSPKSKSSRPKNELWLISEYCNRGPLLTAVERGAFLTTPSVQTGQPNLVSVLQTCQEIAAAMHYLHSNNIVHGDLTGGNVLLTASEKDARGFTAKVVDFGLSRVCNTEVLQTKTLGCAEYMPPELITDGRLAKPADLYAFGVIMWEIYVGRRAWEGLKPTEVLKRVAAKQTLPFPAQTPHRLKILGERCMDYDPAKRPTFSEVLSEVNAILEDTMNILQQFLSASSSRK